MVLIAVLFTFYVGYNPYMADVANPGVTDAATCPTDCGICKDPKWSVEKKNIP